MDSLGAALRAGEPLEGHASRDISWRRCRDPGTWERRVAPQVVSYARAGTPAPNPVAAFAARIRTPAPGLPVHQAGGIVFPSSCQSGPSGASRRVIYVMRAEAPARASFSAPEIAKPMMTTAHNSRQSADNWRMRVS